MWEERRERRHSWGEAAVQHRVQQRPTAPRIPTSAVSVSYGVAEGAHENGITEEEEVEEEEAELSDVYAEGDYTHGPSAARQPWSGAMAQQRGPGWIPEPSCPPPLATIPTTTAMTTTTMTATASSARSHSPAVWIFQDDADLGAGGADHGGDNSNGMESSSLTNNSLSQGLFSGSLYSDPSLSQRTVQLQRRWATDVGSLDDVRATHAPSPRVLDNRVRALSRASSASAVSSMESNDAERGALRQSGGSMRRDVRDADGDAMDSALHVSDSGGEARRFYQVPMAAALHGGRRGSGAQGKRGAYGAHGADHTDLDTETEEGKEEERLTRCAGSVQGRSAAGAVAVGAAANKTSALPASSQGAAEHVHGRALQRATQPGLLTLGTPMDARRPPAGSTTLPPAPVRPLLQQQEHRSQPRCSTASSATQSSSSTAASLSLDASTAAPESPSALRGAPEPRTRELDLGAGTDARRDDVSSSPSEASSACAVEELYLPGIGPLLLLLTSVDTQAAAAARAGEETPASTTINNPTEPGSSLEPYRTAAAMLQREADAHARERAALHARLEAAEQRVRLTEQQVGVAAEARAAELVQGYRADERRRRAQFQATLDTVREENRELTLRLEAAARAPAMGVAATAPSRSLWPASVGDGEAAGRRADPSGGSAGAVTAAVSSGGGGCGALVGTSELTRQLQSVEAYWRDRLRTAERHWEDEMGQQSRQRREALDQVEELVRTVEQTQEELRYTRRQAARLREENTRLCAAAAAAASAGSDGRTAMALAAQPGTPTSSSGALGPAEARQLRQALREHQHREAALLAQVESYGEEATRVRLRAEAALEKAEQDLAAERRRSTEMVKLYGSQLESLHRQLREAKARNTAP